MGIETQSHPASAQCASHPMVCCQPHAAKFKIFGVQHRERLAAAPTLEEHVRLSRWPCWYSSAIGLLDSAFHASTDSGSGVGNACQCPATIKSTAMVGDASRLAQYCRLHLEVGQKVWNEPARDIKFPVAGLRYSSRDS